MSDVIEVSNLTRKFGSFVAVDSVSFEVHDGEIFGYLGANGAGKSTTIRMLCGLLAPSSGKATVAGIDIAVAPEKVKRTIGYMSQKFSLYSDLSAEENLEFFGGTHGLGGRPLRSRTAEVLAAVGLSGQEKTRTQDMPGGYRQRLALACSILHRPKILFLDEPTAGVDPVSRRSFWGLVRSLASSGTTILVTTHFMDEAEYCDRIGLMVDGRLAALDSSMRLKRTHVPGLMYEVRGLPRGEISWLAALDGVMHVETFGVGFHIRVRPDAPIVSNLAEELGKRAAHAVAEAIEPTLEDVFLEVVRAASRPQSAVRE
jgi:ABC-2 type transport system ATP-binding protein